MADSKVSELVSATSVGGSDLLYLVQSNTSKKVTAATLFANAANAVFSGKVSLGGTPQLLASPGVISVDEPITHLAVDATGGTLTIPQGIPGQVKLLTLVSSSGGTYTLSNANIAGGLTVTFDNVGDTVLLVSSFNNKWNPIVSDTSAATPSVTSVGGATGVVSNVQLASAITSSGRLTTANVAEVNNLYYTDARAYANTTAAGFATPAQIAAKANVADLTTSNVVERTNLYFTNARSYANVVELGYITASALSGYATNTQLTDYATTANIANLATISYVDSAIANVSIEYSNIIFTANSSINSIANTSGDGQGYTTLQLVPDNTLFNNDQYLIIDPTVPSHIHIRAGGTQDDSASQLFIGGENSFFSVGTGLDPNVYVAAAGNVWYFNSDGTLSSPGQISTPSLNVSGKSTLNKVVEPYTGIVNATGVTEHNCAQGHLFHHTSINSNFTANFTNFELDNGEATSLTLVLNQGGTAYIANAIQIGGVVQTIKWQGNSQPTGNVNSVDVQSFSILNVGGNYTVLSQLSTFG